MPESNEPASPAQEAQDATAAALNVLMAAVIESSDDAIVTKTLDGIITSWNPGATRVLGYQPEEIIGRPVITLIPEDRREEEVRILANLRAGRRIEHFETVRLTRDGRLIDVSLTISPVRDRTGEIIGASKILRDITARRLMERSLEEERRMLEVVNETSRALSQNLELDKLLQAITDATTRLAAAEFGAFFYNTVDAGGEAFTLVSLTGAPMEAFARFGKPRATPLFGPTFEGKATVRIDDVLADPRYGQWAPHHGMPPGHLPVRSYLAVPVVSRNGSVYGGLFFGHSQVGRFSERSGRAIEAIAAQASVAIDNARLFEERRSLLESERAARTQAEHLSASKDEFVAMLSHELRTPLNAILGWTQILRMGKTDSVDAGRGLEVIERNARAQAQLVDDLLDMSRIAAGQMRLDVQSVMPIAFMQGAIDALRPSAESRGVRLEVLLDPKAGPISGDPGRLQQVVWNLISNGIKFTPGGGKVQITLERVNSHIEISVADTGIGISEDFLPHVFERFRQGDASMRRKHGGLGLGLSIVRHIVELHGGVVHAKSGGEGQGATFRVQLPVTVASRHGHEGDRQHPRASTGAMPGAADLTGIRALVVDDDPDARDLVRRILEHSGAVVQTAASSADALRLVEEMRPDVLVSDIGMPDVDGYEFLRRVRALGAERGGRLPAIALTAFARSEDRTRALLTGYLAHVAKPVEAAEIVATIAAVTGRTGGD